MIVDSHCHAWRRWPYEPAVPDPDSRGRVGQLLYEMDFHGVDQAVLVCARIGDNDDNVEYALEAAAQHPDRLHAFPDFDCEWSSDYHRPGAPDRLRALLDQAPLRGVTHYLRAENDGWLRSQEARACLRVAAEHDLIVSLTATPGWYADARRLAEEFPTVPFLWHHLGLARTPAELDELLAACADVPNLLVKVSGFYYAGPEHSLPNGWDFPYAGTLGIEAVRHLYEQLGPQRLCWGSDYPVCLEHISFRQALEAFRAHCDFVAPADRELVLGGTLARVLETRRPLAR